MYKWYYKECSRFFLFTRLKELRKITTNILEFAVSVNITETFQCLATFPNLYRNRLEIRLSPRGVCILEF